MDKIEQFCETLDYSVLKTNIGDFQLCVDKKKDKNIYKLFHYINEVGWKWQAIYDYEVKDYTVVIQLGLCNFKEVSFIKSEGLSFWNNLLKRYEKEINTHLFDSSSTLPYAYKNRAIHLWDYSSVMPNKIGDFLLDVKPSHGIKGINGTYIIGEYVNINTQSGLILCYNIFRDEFYGELYKEGNALITHDLDGRTIHELEEKLKANLLPLLERVTC